MPFYRTPDGAGTMHLNMGGKPAPLPCRGLRLDTDDPRLSKFCCRVSVALCDAPAGEVDGKPVTCSMPVCEHHRTKGGPNVDYCWRHRTLAPAALPLET
jgi:hypothetical protein